MFQQFLESWRVVRPRSIARMQKLLLDLVEGLRDLKRLAKDDAAATAARFDEVNVRLQELAAKLELQSLRESQLRAVATADAALDEALQQLPAICDEAGIAAHVRAAVGRARLELDPLPHLIVSDLFPSSFYNALVRGIPPHELFADKPMNQQRLKVPLEYGPAFSRMVWTFLLDVVLECALQPALVETFREPLAEWIAREWPPLAANPLGPPMELHSTDGRILLRGRGYRIPPHRDPKWGFLTVLLYLRLTGESERWGTQLYSVEEDDAAHTIAPHWIDPDRCRLVVDVPFRRNTALVFLNSRGAHGAFIPEDAEPPDLQRYVYQFRIGPTKSAIEALVAMLPDEQRSLWEGKGKVADYLA